MVDKKSSQYNGEDLKKYIDKLTKDNKPILTFGDIDEKMKSGAFQRTYLERLPKGARIVLAVTVIGVILYELISNIIVSLN